MSRSVRVVFGGESGSFTRMLLRHGNHHTFIHVPPAAVAWKHVLVLANKSMAGKLALRRVKAVAGVHDLAEPHESTNEYVGTGAGAGEGDDEDDGYTTLERMTANECESCTGSTTMHCVSLGIASVWDFCDAASHVLLE